MNKPSKWISVFVPTSDDAFEAVSNYMFEHGALGTEERPEGVLAYFRGADFSKDAASALEIYLEGIRGLGCEAGKPVWSDVADEDWGAKWREGFRPVAVTSRLVVKPPWEKTPSGFHGVVVDIYPRMAFGTGTHETTQLCLILLEKHLSAGDAVLDLGTGSGILAIAAAKLGAGRVMGLDPDQDAVDNAVENVATNKVEDRVCIRKGSVENINDVPRASCIGKDKKSSEFQVPGSKMATAEFRSTKHEARGTSFDLIVANIDRVTLVDMIPRLKGFVKDEGKLILSGILTAEREIILDVLAKAHWKVHDMPSKGEWTGLFCSSEGSP
jgi:ribosomal protein L11 methyltransferase